MKVKADAKTLMLLSNFPEMLAELNEAWAAEQQRRRVFREELTPEMKAEFIEGQVHMHSPAMAQHIMATKNLAILLNTWVMEHRLGLITIEKALVCLARNDFEPDIAFFGPEKAAKIKPTDMQFPAPDFVIEVLSPSTEHVDRGIKFHDYAKHGVREYWLVDSRREFVERYALDESLESYQLQAKHESGDITSSVIEGFSIPIAAIFDEAAQHQALKGMLG
jgi:Uma2 family endonuclease